MNIRTHSSRFRQAGWRIAPLLLIALLFSAQSRADWVNNSSEGMPFDAIGGGHDDSETPQNQNMQFYVCRAYHNNDIQPGWALWGDSVCHFGYGGLELTSSNFDWYIPSWTISYRQGMPSNAIPMGAEPVGGVPTYRYACRVGLTPGKYGADFGACYYPYGGREAHQFGSGFEWLVDPGNNVNQSLAASLTQYTSFDNVVIGPYMMVDMGDEVYQDASQTIYVNWPNDAIVAGVDSDGTLLYACTVFYMDGMQPGKARKDWNACDISWGGTEHYIGRNGHFNLITPAYVVKSTSNLFCANQACSVHTNPIPVGKDSDGSILYSCLGYTKSNLTVPGKTRADWGGYCSIAYNGVEQQSYPDAGLILTDGYR